jgi:coenzyme F420 hydrogenase subunit beta
LNSTKEYEQLISDYNSGTGIAAIVNDNIEMVLDEKGEFVPFFKKNIESFSNQELLELKNVNCITSDSNEDDIARKLFKNIPEMRYNKSIGYFSELYIGHVTEGKYRENGSSGGLGTWVFKELFSKDLIDGVIHVKKAENSELLFEYDISKSIEEIQKGAKTKYYPVEYSKVLKLVKENPGRYAIIGLPNYIMNLRLLAECDEQIKQSIKFYIGLVCGHQKSAKFAEFIAWQCGITPGNLLDINFRKKLPDKPANSYGVEVTGLKNGEKITIVKPMNELLGSNWGQGFFKVRASDFSDDVMNETADLTLGDAWLPEYTVDSKGNNIVIVRNPIIGEIINEAIENQKVCLDLATEEQIIKSQESHFRHTRDELGYRLFKKERKNEWVPIKRVSPSNDLDFIRKRIQDIREIMCIKLPEYYLHALEKNNLTYFEEKSNFLVFVYQNLYRMINLKKKIKKKIGRN